MMQNSACAARGHLYYTVDRSPFHLALYHIGFILPFISNFVLTIKHVLTDQYYITWFQCMTAYIMVAVFLLIQSVFNCVFPGFLGGLSLHLNHLIASRLANYDWPFGTLPFGLFGSNLDTRHLETYPRTYSGHF